jgi:Lon protease-like protein
LNYSEEVEEKRVFIFPLKNSLLLPGSVLPLNIFESRYVQMLEDALESNTPIVVCPPPSDSANLAPKLRFLHRYAAAGRPEILQRREDGSCVILLHGMERVLLDEVIEEKPYIQCRAFPVSAKIQLDERYLFKLNRLRRELLDWAEDHLVNADYDLFEEASENAETLLDMATAIFVDEIETRDQLLQESDINARLKSILAYIERVKKNKKRSTKSKGVLVK